LEVVRIPLGERGRVRISPVRSANGKRIGWGSAPRFGRSDNDPATSARYSGRDNAAPEKRERRDKSKDHSAPETRNAAAHYRNLRRLSPAIA
jgi:hypothetical protein